MTSIRPEDFALVAWATGYLALVVLLLLGAGKALSVRWRDVLNAREWAIAAKLACIVFLLLLLILGQNALDLPQQMFIYGRF